MIKTIFTKNSESETSRQETYRYIYKISDIEDTKYVNVNAYYDTPFVYDPQIDEDTPKTHIVTRSGGPIYGNVCEVNINISEQWSLTIEQGNQILDIANNYLNSKEQIGGKIYINWTTGEILPGDQQNNTFSLEFITQSKQLKIEPMIDDVMYGYGGDGWLTFTEGNNILEKYTVDPEGMYVYIEMNYTDGLYEITKLQFKKV